MNYVIEFEYGWQVELDVDPNTPISKERKKFSSFKEAEQELNEIVKRYPFLKGKVVDYRE